MTGDDTAQTVSSSASRKVGSRDLKQLGWINSETSELLPGISITPGMRVVDIGCGNGAYIGFCARMGADVVFIDRKEDSIRALEGRMSKLSGATSMGIVSECDPIPLPDDYADVVICTEVLEHVRDPEALTREITRIGKQSSIFVLTVPESRGEYLIKDVAHPSYFEEPNHIRIFTSDDFENLVKRCGLEVDRHEYRGAFWAIFYLFKWVTSEPGEDLSDDVHPVTKLWARTWAEVLAHPDSRKIVNAMDLALPKTQIIIARKTTPADVADN